MTLVVASLTVVVVGGQCMVVVVDDGEREW